MNPVHDLPIIAPAIGGLPVKFPVGRHATAASFFDGYAEEATRVAKSVDGAALDRAAAILLDAYTGGAGVFACGNGGSAAIANHLQCDHSKGVRTATDLLPKVVSLSVNVELLTARSEERRVGK